MGYTYGIWLIDGYEHSRRFSEQTRSQQQRLLWNRQVKGGTRGRTLALITRLCRCLLLLPHPQVIVFFWLFQFCVYHVLHNFIIVPTHLWWRLLLLIACCVLTCAHSDSEFSLRGPAPETPEKVESVSLWVLQHSPSRRAEYVCVIYVNLPAE